MRFRRMVLAATATEEQLKWEHLGGAQVRRRPTIHLGDVLLTKWLSRSQRAQSRPWIFTSTAVRRTIVSQDVGA
jgi:hypothetical protein